MRMSWLTEAVIDREEAREPIPTPAPVKVECLDRVQQKHELADLRELWRGLLL